MSTYLLIGSDRVVGAATQQPLPNGRVWPRVRNACIARAVHCIVARGHAMSRHGVNMHVQLFHELFSSSKPWLGFMGTGFPVSRACACVARVARVVGVNR